MLITPWGSGIKIIQIDAAHRELKAQGRDPVTVASLEHVGAVQGKMLRTQVKSYLELTTERRTKALKAMPQELARVIEERHPATLLRFRE